MELTLLEQSENKLELSFMLKNSSPALANALRRTVISFVPTLAIEDVEIRKNSSVLYDEMLAHRLGLIPLVTDSDSYVLPAKCKCKGEGCANCQVAFTIQVSGPGPVFAKEIKFKDPKIKAVHDEMLIVDLKEGQEVEVEGTAILGQGIDHMKFSPGIIHYKYKPVIEITEQPDKPSKVAESCPKNIFEVKNGKIEINKDKIFDCHLCGACPEASEGKIKLNEKDNEYLFYVESFGQLEAKDMVLQGISQIMQGADDFVKSLKTIAKEA